MKLKKSKRRTINLLKLVIGLTIFRRWRAVHGAEEQPSPSGFAMVFHKAPTSPNNISGSTNIGTTTNSTTTSAATNKKNTNKSITNSNLITQQTTSPPPSECSTKNMVISHFFYISHHLYVSFSIRHLTTTTVCLVRFGQCFYIIRMFYVAWYAECTTQNVFSSGNPKYLFKQFNFTSGFVVSKHTVLKHTDRPLDIKVRRTTFQ